MQALHPILSARAFKAAWVALALLLAGAGRAQAHDPGLSSASLTLDGGEITAVVTLNAADLAPLLAAQGGGTATLPANAGALGARLLEIHVDGRAIPAQSADFQPGEKDDPVLRLAYPEVRGARLEARAAALGEMPLGHRQWAEIKTTHGRVLASRLLNADSAALSADLSSESSASEPAPHTFRWVPACSALISLAGAWWLLDRTVLGG